VIGVWGHLCLLRRFARETNSTPQKEENPVADEEAGEAAETKEGADEKPDEKADEEADEEATAAKKENVWRFSLCCCCPPLCRWINGKIDSAIKSRAWLPGLTAAVEFMATASAIVFISFVGSFDCDKIYDEVDELPEEEDDDEPAEDFRVECGDDLAERTLIIMGVGSGLALLTYFAMSNDRCNTNRCVVLLSLCFIAALGFGAFIFLGAYLFNQDAASSNGNGEIDSRLGTILVAITTTGLFEVLLSGLNAVKTFVPSCFGSPRLVTLCAWIGSGVYIATIVSLAGVGITVDFSHVSDQV